MRLIIDINDDIAKGIRGEYDCKIEPREIVRSFQSTIAEAIAKGTPYEERPQGEWIEYQDCYDDTYYTCSHCGEDWITIEGKPTDNLMNYCPMCGADMREADNEVSQQ